MTYVNLLLIAIICVCIIDISGIVDSVKGFLSKVITSGYFTTSNYRIKPFDCSLCMTHWTGLIYLLCIGELSWLTYSVLLLIAISTPLILEAITLVQDLITTLFNKLRKLC